MHNSFERKIHRDVENGQSPKKKKHFSCWNVVNVENGDDPSESQTNRIMENRARRGKRDGDVENGLDSERDQPINHYTRRVNDLLRRPRSDVSETSSPSRVKNDFLATKKDEPINSSATRVEGMLDCSKMEPIMEKEHLVEEPFNFSATRVKYSTTNEKVSLMSSDQQSRFKMSSSFSVSTSIDEKENDIRESDWTTECDEDDVVGNTMKVCRAPRKEVEPINSSATIVEGMPRTSEKNCSTEKEFVWGEDEPSNSSRTRVNQGTLRSSAMESLTESNLVGNPKFTIGSSNQPPIVVASSSNQRSSSSHPYSKKRCRRTIQTNTEIENHMRRLAFATENKDDIRESALTTKRGLDEVSPKGNTVMHIAAMSAEDEWVEELAKNKSYLLAEKNCNHDTPLHVAARFKHKKTLEKLLVALVRNLDPPYSEKPKEALDKILVKNKQGNTFFHEAVLNGQKNVMKILDHQELKIEPGFKELVGRAALFWTNKEQKSILHIAIEEGYEDIVVDALSRLSQHHALDELIQNHQELAQIIWEAESPFPRQDQGREMKKEQRNSIAMDTLEEPPFRDRPEIVSKYMRYIDMRILMKGYSENMLPGNIEHKKLSQDPSTHKVSEKYQEPAQLIPRGHDYVPPGKSPLIVAIFKHHDGRGILKNILDKKKEWIHHLKDNEGRTVIHYAASKGYLEVIEPLLRMQTDCSMERDNDGFFPLHLASAGGHVEVIERLLKHCYKIEDELVDNYGRNFIHIAAEMGKYNVIRSMLDRPDYPKIEMMVNFKDVNGNTPLHLATLHCHPKVVHALAWDKRVDCSLVNKRNETALDVCMQFQREFSSLRQRLIWIALESVGTQKHVIRSQHPLKLPPRTQNAENDRKQEGQNMDLYKDRINTLMLVSTLITTVTFAAGFTLPGGTNSSDPEKGMALMLNQVWFKVFVFCITISMYGAIGVTIILIWAQLGDINLTRLALKVTLPLLGFTLTTLSVAFLAGVHLVISDLSWLATALLVLCVIFIIILVALYILLLFFSSSGSRVFRYVLNCPLKFLIWLEEQGQTHEGTVPETEPPPESFSNKFLHFTFFCRRCFSVTRSEMSSKEN